MSSPALNPESWLDDYGDYLYSIAYSRLADKQKCEDLVQDTFLGAFKARESYDGRVEIKYWLRGILRNKIVDLLRKSTKDFHLSEDLGFTMDDSFFVQNTWVLERKVDNWEFDPSSSMQKKEFWDSFRVCLNRLQDPMKGMYLMKEIEGQEFRKVCEDFGVKESTLWVILHRARKNLKSCLNAKWGRNFKE